MKRILFYFIVLSLIIPFCIARVLGGMLCQRQSDCNDNECCAVRHYLSSSSSGFCMPAKQLGDRCMPSLIYGKGYTCGCREGLTCALVEQDEKTKRQKHRCVKILPAIKEIKEESQQVAIDSLPETSRLTAELVRKLLDSYKDRNDKENKKTT